METTALLEIVVGLGLMITVFTVGIVRAQYVTNK